MADFEVLETILEGGLRLDDALQFNYCPFWAVLFPAVALHLNLHLSLSLSLSLSINLFCVNTLPLCVDCSVVRLVWRLGLEPTLDLAGKLTALFANREGKIK